MVGSFQPQEALLMARSFELSFSSNVKVTLTRSPPASVENVSEPFIRPSTELPGSGSSAAKHQPTSKAMTSRPTSATKFPGTGSSAGKHQLTSQTQTSRPTSSAKFPGSGSSAVKHQPTSQTSTSQPTLALNTDPSTTLHSTTKLDSHRPHIDQPSAADRPLSSDPTDTSSPALHRSRRDSISQICLQMPAVTCPTDLPWIYTLRKGNCLRIQIRLSLTRTSQFLRNRPTEALYKAFAHLWAGCTYRI